jgi:hypothetical protein
MKMWLQKQFKEKYSKELLQKEYQEKQKSYRQITKELWINGRTLWKLLSYYRIPTRHWSEAIKSQRYWKKWQQRRRSDRNNARDRIITTDWYYEIKFDWEHRSLNKGRVKEHILIMEDLIWRRLEKWEVVHHIDLNKLNNLPSNLQLMTASEHHKLHWKIRKENQ